VSARRTFGESIGRLEDDALLTGRGRFVDDITLPSVAEAAFLRSPYAHAKIQRIDVSAALSMPGVIAVLTLEDLRPYLTTDRLAVGMPSASYRLFVDRPVLASTEVVHVGEAIAVVVAETRYLAEDALNFIELDVEPLDAVTDCREALRPNAPRVHSDQPHNLLAEFDLGYGNVDLAFKTAATVVREEFWLHRGAAHSMEGRGVLARFDSMERMLTLWNSTQTPNVSQRLIVDLLGLEETEVRVVAPDVGGGFGPKLVFYPEEVIIPIAAMITQRPVKWIEDRREHFMSTTQERDQYWSVEIAVDDDAKVLGIRGALIHDHGAYTARGVNIPYNSALTVPLPYNVPNYHVDVKLALTNKVPVTPIRGAGQPQGTFVMERLLDRVAVALNLDRAEVRRRNLVQADQMPCQKQIKLRGGTYVTLDSGDYPAAQQAVLDASGWATFPERQAAARAKGRHIGIGLANYVEGTGRGPFEPVRVRVSSSGKILVSSSATAMGQSTKTMLAQIVAEQFGGDMQNIIVTTGDTAAMASGFGGFNSRQAVMAGSSAHRAAMNVRNKTLLAASHMLEVAVDDLEIIDSRVRVVGSDKFISLGDVARAMAGIPGYQLPGDLEPGLDATENVIVHDMAFSSGSAVAEVEVDIETGEVRVTNFVLSHDCGRMINPMLVDGQVIGGIAHGLGNALFEWMGYDANAQPITTNFGEYLLITATEMPPIKVMHRETPSPLNALGVKGVGESGVIPVAAAVVSAVENALSDFGVRLAHAPLTPMDVLAAITEASQNMRR